MDQRFIYSAPFMVAAALMIVLALLIWPRRHARGAVTLLMICGAAAAWAYSEGLLYLGYAPEANLRITLVQYLGIAPLPPLAVIFVLTVFDFDDSWRRRCWAVLMPLAGLVLLLVWTNGWHQWVFARTYPIPAGPFVMLGLVHGPAWWGIIAYHYLLLAVTSLLLVHQVRFAMGAYRFQAAAVLTAVMVVWVVNAVYICGLSPVPNMDMAPIAFSLVAGTMAWGLFRFSLLDVVPVAKTAIFNGMADAIVVLDGKKRIVDVNPAAQALFRIDGGQAVGAPADRLTLTVPGIRNVLEGAADADEVTVTEDGGERTFDVRAVRLFGRKGNAIGRVVTLHDISARRRMADALGEKNTALTALAAQLQATLSEVKELSGLLPICAHCKKIRDDAGYWNQLEEFLSKHSKADFSHGICPDCVRRHYPEASDILDGKDGA